MPDIIHEYSYLGLFLILFIEEGGIPIPIPGDFFIATIATLPKTNYFLIIATVAAATLTGSTILFTLAKKIGHKLLVKYGKYIKLNAKKTRKVEVWFAKYGGAAIVIGRLIPGLRTITPFAAGLFGINYKTFWIYTTFAALIWANVYYFIGRFFWNFLTKI